MKINIKTFADLSTTELYKLLQLRSEVFVVEQECVYQDLDYKDQKAIHVLGYLCEELVAYTRVFKPDDYFKLSSIGRVVVKKKYRKSNYGYDIMRASINTIKQNFNENKIKISAQVYLKDFYNNLGFNEEGNIYLEDGIPHTVMIKNN